MLDERVRTEYTDFLIKIHRYGFYDEFHFGTFEKNNILFLGASLVRSLNFKYLEIDLSLKYFETNLIGLFLYGKYSKLFVKDIKANPNINFYGENRIDKFSMSFACYKLGEEKIEEKFFLHNLTNLSITHEDKKEENVLKAREKALEAFYGKPKLYD